MVWRSTVTWAVNLFSCATELCSILDPGNMDPLFHVRKVCASTPARSCWMWVKPLGARFYLLTFLSTGAPQSTTKPRISDMGRLQVEASMPKTFLTNLVAVQQNAKPIRWWATLLSLESFRRTMSRRPSPGRRPVGLTLGACAKDKQLGNRLVWLLDFWFGKSLI